MFRVPTGLGLSLKIKISEPGLRTGYGPSSHYALTVLFTYAFKIHAPFSNTFSYSSCFVKQAPDVSGRQLRVFTCYCFFLRSPDNHEIRGLAEPNVWYIPTRDT